jgi:lipid II:glycine glycyltransferase (peptidoglycan interpeptide bridge formation enzyme)
MTTSPKQRKYEKANNRFVEGVLEKVGAADSSVLFRTVAATKYDDPRPFVWNDLRIRPQFTYVVDVGNADDVEELMSDFSKSLRNEMRRLDKLDVQIQSEGITGAQLIYDEVEARFAEQDETPPVSGEFVCDVFKALGDRARAYVARDDAGEYLGGIITLYSNDRAYYWQGGVRNSYENVSVNTLIHRRILEDVISDPELDSVQSYDLVGANTERLCSYKGQFSGSVKPYYVAESSGIGMKAAKRVYQAISGSLTKN